MNDAKRRTALVSGGADGIGWAISERLIDHGWRVVVGDINVELAIAREADTAGALIGCKLDVRSSDDVAAVFDFMEREWGGVDLLVNNAGIQTHARTEELAWEDWQRVIDVNLNGAFRCTQAAGRSMLARGDGVIVNIVSVTGERGAPGRAAYCASKSGLVALTKVTAVEWAGRGVRVNAVGPGYVDSPLLAASITDGQLSEEEILSRIPAGRVGTADEIAAVVCFLASTDASYLTGQVIYVDGGFLVDYGIHLQREARWIDDRGAERRRRPHGSL